MDLLITYDITDTEDEGATRLRAVAEVCEAYGIRAQFSVFECRVSPAKYAKMVGELADAIDPNRDSIHIYRLAGSIVSNRSTLGITKHQEVGKPWIF